MTRTLVRALACALFGFAVTATAQQYPSRPIDFIIPLAAGDATDTAARAIADKLAQELKVAVVPQNRPGAGGGLGTDVVVKGAKDGTVIGIPNNAALVFRPILDPKTAHYDPLKDLTPLALAMRSPTILVVGADQPYKNLQEMVEFSKNNPGKVRIGTAGVGSVGDFCIQTINSATGASLTMVPFPGAMPSVNAMLGNHIEGVVLALGTMTSYLASGKVRGIVISSKWPDYPAIPTMQELGYKQPLFGVWTGIFAPAGISPEVSNVLVPALERAVRSPDLAAKLKPLGILAEYQPPEKLIAEMKDEQERVRRIGRQAGLLK